MKQQRPNAITVQAPRKSPPKPATVTPLTSLTDPTTAPAPSATAPEAPEPWHHHTHGDRRPSAPDAITNNASTSFKFDGSNWLKTTVIHAGLQLIQTFSDPDGDHSYTPVRPDAITGAAAESGGRGRHRHGGFKPEHNEVLSFDGTTLSLTETERFGTAVTTFTDPDKDGVFSKVATVFTAAAAPPLA